MSIRIKKAKLTKDRTLEAVYFDDDNNEITLRGSNTVHIDLVHSLAVLIPYFAELTEQKEADIFDWNNPASEENIDLIRRINVTGVSLGVGNGGQIAVLTGQRTLLSSKVLNLNSPAVDIDNDDTGWARADDFRFAIDAFIHEAEEYIINRKWAVRQQEINFDNTDDDPFAEAGIPDNGIPLSGGTDVA